MAFLKVVTKGSVSTFTLGNGDGVTIDADELNDAMREAAMHHGIRQKVRDSASGRSKTLDYNGALDDMQSTVDSMYNGSWNRKGTASTRDVITAIARLTGESEESIQERWDIMDEDVQKEVMKEDAVKAMMLEIKLERAKEKVKGKTFTFLVGDEA